MNRIVIILQLLVIAAIGTFTATAQAPAEKQRIFQSVLKEGQSVSLKEVSGKYDINTVQGVAAVQSHKVVEIGADFVVVKDVAGLVETHIPLWSIKSIIRLKVPKE